jgi:lysophospholipase L1-like esterase
VTSTYVALGDSITLGVGDPIRRAGASLTWRGWAAILAESLDPAGPAGWHNLAVNGACVADVERHQLPKALALRPDVASVVVGVNDTLRSGFRADRIAGSLAHTVGALRAAGAQVLTMKLPDPGRMFGLPGLLARPLAGRMAEVNAAVEEVSGRFGAILFDAASDPDTYDRRMWAVDRLHPSERGHRLLACRFHHSLGAAGYPVGPPPDPEPSNRPPSRLAEFGWLATKGSAWVLRRSTDLLPALLAMAVREALTGGAPAPLELGGLRRGAEEESELTWPTA